MGVFKPPGMDQVFPMMCGTCSNENAIKLMFMKHQREARGERPFSAEEEASALKGQFPGVPNLKVLAFEGGFHGRTIGLLSCSSSK